LHDQSNAAFQPETGIPDYSPKPTEDDIEVIDTALMEEIPSLDSQITKPKGNSSLKKVMGKFSKVAASDITYLKEKVSQVKVLKHDTSPIALTENRNRRIKESLLSQITFVETDNLEEGGQLEEQPI
jgi:hypothetical protein